MDMPRTACQRELLSAVLAAQDQVIHRRQAYGLGLNSDAVAHRGRYAGWQEVLRNVFLAHPGEPGHRQRLVAALLYAGESAAIDADDACVFHGLRAVRADDQTVRVVVPQLSPARSHGFVVVRRSSASWSTVTTPLVRYVDPATAAISAARIRHDPRRVLAILSDAVQRGITTYDALLRAHVRASPRNARPADAALYHLRCGIRSVGEADFRTLAEASGLLPPLAYNCVLRLPDGRQVCPDAIALDAGLVHETNGAVAHRRADLFADMQERHDAMTAAGLTVLHNTPARLSREPRRVIAEFERCYDRLRGRGLPDGITVVRFAVTAA